MVKYSVTRIDFSNPVHRFVMLDYYRKLFQSKQGEFAFPTSDIEDYAEAVKEIVDNPMIVLYAVVKTGEENLPVVGTCHLTDHSGKSVAAHFNFNPDVKEGHKEIGDIFLNYLFSLHLKEDGSPAYETIIGKTPAYNRPAIKYAESLGFERLGRIEKALYSRHRGKIVDIILTKLTRKRYEQRKSEHTSGTAR